MIKLSGFDWGMTLSQNTPEFRYQRRMFEQHFRPAVVQQYASKHERSAIVLLHNLLESPARFLEHVR